MVGDHVLLTGTPQPRFERATVADGGGPPPGAGRERGASALPRFAELAPRVEITTPLVNGAVAARIDTGGDFDTAVAFVVEDGRITRVYAMRDPHELGRLDEVAELRR
ncbi:hypothetical protein [Geodermatophilus africanus]|nr:hypothetical protein [Geodermatophilus africanus]